MTPDKLRELAEIDIRGRFMNMSCDMEMVMLHILVYLSPDPYNQKRKFYNMHMHEKIQNTICDLKLYKRSLYEKYENDLLKLWDFKELRNSMAHSAIVWVNTGIPLQSFRIIYVTKWLLNNKFFILMMLTTYSGDVDHLELWVL